MDFKLVSSGENNQKSNDTSVKTVEFCIVNNATMYGLNNRFIWFKKWVIGRQTFQSLSAEGRYSKVTLQRTVYKFLAQAPLIKIRINRELHMRIDGTYFK